MKQLGGMIAPGDGLTFAGRISFDDRVGAIEAASPDGDDYILPGFIDLQVNGSHGIDVMTATSDAILALARQLAGEGTTAFLPTAVTAPVEQIERAHAAISRAMSQQATGGAAADKTATILGMHLEGPFISSVRLGAHPPLNLEPRGEPFEHVLKLQALKLITIAPELAGAPDAIGRLCARGVVVSIGHTDATWSETNAALAVGARMFTHLFNAMRPMHHRDPGVIGAAMLASEAIAAVIADGVHVDPVLLKLLYRVRGAAGMILTSDKVAPAGGGNVPRRVGRAQAKVEGGAARLVDGTLAGSVITMLDGARLMVEKVGVSVGEVAQIAAANPAAMLHADDRGRLAIGARADLVLLSRELKLKAVFIGGKELA